MNRAIPWTKLMARKNFFTADLNLKAHNVLSGVGLAIFLPWLCWALFTADPLSVAVVCGMTLLMYVFLNFGILRFVGRQERAAVRGWRSRRCTW